MATDLSARHVMPSGTGGFYVGYLTVNYLMIPLFYFRPHTHSCTKAPSSSLQDRYLQEGKLTTSKAKEEEVKATKPEHAHKLMQRIHW